MDSSDDESDDFVSFESDIREKLEEVTPKKRLFKCDLCAETFSSSSLLQKHAKAVHPASASYVCRVCYKKFNTTSNLKRHSLTHERIPPGNNNPDCRSNVIDHNEGILHPTPHQGGPKVETMSENCSNHNKSEPVEKT